MAHAAFYGIGAYVAAIMAIKLNCAFGVTVLCSIIFSMFFGILIGVSTLRIKGDYFVIATFAFQVITFSILNNWVGFTGGPDGIPGIPQPVILGWRVTSSIGFLLIVGGICAIIIWGGHRIGNSPFGRVLKAIREDEIFTQSKGKSVETFKILIFTLGAGIAALAGSLYAYYVSYINPTSFTVMESIFIICIVIIGGAGSTWGPVIGALVLVTLPEILRFVGLPNSIAANLRQILYGGLLVTFMIWRPRGFLGKYAFQNREARK